ncbi:MAG TPA: permease-like cell division protein FtsX [Jatrophihabitans sp.]|jgi:cell division transport system permease protein
MRASFVLSGVAAGIRRNATMTIALILNTAIALGFVGAAILANTEITRFRSTYEDKLNVQVYLCTSLAYDQQESAREVLQKEHKPAAAPTCAKNAKTTTQQTAAIEALLKKDPRVASVSYISEQKALEIGRKQLPDSAPYLKLGTFPASFSVKLSNIKKDYGAFAATYDQVNGVDKVNNQIATINALLSLIDSARWISIVIALVVLAASVLLIGNTIQVAANQRRNETSIMRLVGASRWMTELPFMLEAIIAAAVGGMIAIGFIAVGKYVLLDHVLGSQTAKGVIPNLGANDILLAGGAGLIVGVVLSALTALATLRLYVRL